MRHIFIIDYYKFNMESVYYFLKELKSIGNSRSLDYKIILTNNYQETRDITKKYSYQDNTIIYAVGDTETLNAAIQNINPDRPLQYLNLQDYKKLNTVFNNFVSNRKINLLNCNNERFISDLKIGCFLDPVISSNSYKNKEDLDLSYYPNYQEKNNDLKDKNYEYLGLKAINNSKLIDVSIIPLLSRKEFLKFAYLYNNGLDIKKYSDYFTSDNISIYNEKKIDYSIDGLNRIGKHITITTIPNSLTLKK